MCGAEAHVSCAYPAVKAKRSPLFANHTCDECVEYELETGYDEATGARMKAAGKLANLAGLTRTAMELEALAVAGGTHGTYATGVAALNRFMSDDMELDADAVWQSMATRRGESAAEADERERQTGTFWRTVHRFAASALGRFKHSTICNYIDGGVAGKLRDMGVPVSRCPTKHHRVRRVLQGLQRRLGDDGVVKKQATGMDDELLELMVGDLVAGRVRNMRGDGFMGKFEARQAAIVLLLEWAALARRSEVAGLPMERWQRDGDVIVVEWSGADYRRAKGDQASSGSTSTVPAEVLGFPLGTWMEEQQSELLAMGLSVKDKMFRHAQRPRQAAWHESGEAINVMLKRVVSSTIERYELKRPDVRTYTSHSLRRGGAQYLRDKGVTRELIKLMGRWKSDAVDDYLKTAAEKTRRAVASVFRGRSGRRFKA